MMTFGKLSYLMTALIFMGIPTLILVWLARHKLSGRWGLFWAVTLTSGLWIMVTEPAALTWQAWFYGPDRFLGLTLLMSPLETVFGQIMCGSALICVTTLIASDLHDERRPIISSMVSRAKRKLNSLRFF